MNHHIPTPFLVFLFLLLILPCQAQNAIHCDLVIKESAIDNSEIGIVKHIYKGEFIFRKMNKSWRIMAFTAKDAQIISDYFLEDSQVVACHTHYIDKKVKVFAENRSNTEAFPFKEHIDALQEMGYFITSFHKSEDIVVFPMQNCNAAFSIRHYDEDMAIYLECPPCGEITVKDKQDFEEEDLIKVYEFNATPKEEEALTKTNNTFPLNEVDNGSRKASQSTSVENIMETNTTQNLDLELKGEGNYESVEGAAIQEIMKLSENRASGLEGSELRMKEDAAIQEIMELSENRASGLEGSEAPMKEDAAIQEIMELSENRASGLEGSEVPMKEEAAIQEIMELSENRASGLEENKMSKEEAAIQEIMELSENRETELETSNENMENKLEKEEMDAVSSTTVETAKEEKLKGNKKKNKKVKANSKSDSDN